MADSPKVSPEKETPTRDVRMDVAVPGPSGASSDARMQSWESDISSDEDFDLKAMISNRVTSFFSVRREVPEFDEDDDEDFKRFASFPRRRTFSQCDSPTYSLPECKIYDSEAEDEGEMRSSDQKKNLKKFLKESTTWNKVRRLMKPAKDRRVINSDGEMLNMSYCTDANKISSLFSRLFLKRSLSAPPNSSTETEHKQKIRIGKLYHHFLKPGSKSLQSPIGIQTKDTSDETKPSSENLLKDIGESEASARTLVKDTKHSSTNPKESCSVDKSKSVLQSERASESATKFTLEKPKESCLEDNKSQSPSSKNSSGLIESSLESSKGSCSENTEPSSLGKAYTETESVSDYSKESCMKHAGKSKSPPEKALTRKSLNNSDNSEISCLVGSNLVIETSSSENSELSWIIDAEISSSPLEYTERSDTCSSSENSEPSGTEGPSKPKSPPQITSEPPDTNPDVIKVPTKKTESAHSTPESSAHDSSGTSAKSEDNVTHRGSVGRPTDFNVKRRSAFYSFCSSSPTGLMLRPYRSLPNVNVPPRKNGSCRSIQFNESNMGVVRSLFTGNYWSDRYTPSTGMSAISRELASLLKRSSCSSEARQGSSNEGRQGSSNEGRQGGQDLGRKTKVCKKLFTSPISKETNANKTLQDHSSSELFGAISNLNLSEVNRLTPPPEDAALEEAITPKRKETSPASTECFDLPVKKVRSSSEFRLEEASGKNTSGGPEVTGEPSHSKEESKDLLKPPSHRDSGENTSPKRKVEDLEDGSNALPDIRSPESASKKTKIKPPTPIDEINIKDNLPEKKSETKDEQNSGES